MGAALGLWIAVVCILIDRGKDLGWVSRFLGVSVGGCGEAGEKASCKNSSMVMFTAEQSLFHEEAVHCVNGLLFGLLNYTLNRRVW